jgi:hypothetical protein
MHKSKRDTHLGSAPAEICTKVKGIPTWAPHLQRYAKLAACGRLQIRKERKENTTPFGIV